MEKKNKRLVLISILVAMIIGISGVSVSGAGLPENSTGFFDAASSSSKSAMPASSKLQQDKGSSSSKKDISSAVPPADESKESSVSAKIPESTPSDKEKTESDKKQENEEETKSEKPLPKAAIDVGTTTWIEAFPDPTLRTKAMDSIYNYGDPAGIITLEEYSQLQAVTVLNLNNYAGYEYGIKDLTGIGIFTGLTELYFAANNIGVLPAELGNLVNLKKLDVSANALTDLPLEMANLTQLEELDILNSSFTVFPDVIFSLHSLKVIYCTASSISELPDKFENLPNLEKFILRKNLLSDIPASFSNLKNLMWLSLDDNKFSQFPEVLTSLQSLESLDMSGNTLQSIPDSFGKLTKLQSIYFRQNNITTFPDVFASLPDVSELMLSENALTSLPPSIVELDNLMMLEISVNYIQSLPKGLANMEMLFMFNAMKNQLIDIPPEVVNRFDPSTFVMQSYTRYIQTGYMGYAYTFQPLPIYLQAPYYHDWAGQPVDINYFLEKPNGTTITLNSSQLLIQDGMFTLPKELMDELGEYTFRGTIQMSPYSDPNEYRQIFTVETLVKRTVSFNTGIGATEVPAQSVIKGTPASEPAPPMRNGYTFKGWFEYQSKAEDWRNSTIWNFNTPIQNDTTLYAAWAQNVENSHSVTFVFGNGTPNKVIEVVKGELIPPVATPVRNGYTFENWTTNDLVWNFNTMTMPGENIVLKANWKEVPSAPSSSAPPASSSSTPSSSSVSSIPPSSSAASRPSGSSSSNTAAGVSSSHSTASTASEESTLQEGSSVAGIYQEESQTAGNAQRREETLRSIEEAGGRIIRIGNGQVPLFGNTSLFVWSLFNLLATVAACVLAGICGYKLYGSRPKKEELPYYKWHLAAIASAVVAVITLLIASNFGGVMVLFDSISVVFALLSAVCIAGLLFVLKNKPTLPDKTEEK